jgi:formylmethanofuran dehydrogenase subunit E
MDIDFGGLYLFHGHRCPMSTMGARLGAAAMDALGVTKADQFKVRGVYRSRNCALDGVQFVTGCTLGNSNLELEDKGLASFTLFWRETRGAVTAAVSKAALARFAGHKKRKAELEHERPEAPPERIALMESELKEEFERLIDWVQSAPVDELVDITRT